MLIMSEWAKKELSILIPNYNNMCVGLVTVLQRQAEALGIDYEILVADDASPQKVSIQQNQAINDLPHCRYIVKETNTGSAATRNYLGKRSQYHWLLFLDCDITIPDDHFLERYMADAHDGVVNGGICIIDDANLSHNLRYLYEKAAESAHTAEIRQANKYHEFRSTNFMIERKMLEACPFDERFKRSGYEDVLFGKMLKQQQVPVTHIDNPVMMTEFESNPDYVSKIERSMQTLHTFRHELRGYSRILTFDKGIHISAVRGLIRLWHYLFGGWERRNLCGKRPWLKLFSLYRLGYYLTLPKD
jgi:glycosyltransferase involved in cell wall biosynthesis